MQTQNPSSQQASQDQPHKIKIRSGFEIDISATTWQGKFQKPIYRGNNDFIIAKIGDMTCVGFIHEPTIGALYNLTGEFEQNKKYNNEWQFKFKSYTVKIDHETGLKEYLAREAPHIGPATANLLVMKFKEKTLDHLESASEELRKTINGFSETKILDIQKWAKGERSNYAIKEKLYNIGLFPSQVERLISHYGNNAEEKIRQDCFSLTEIKGFGFKTVSMIGDLLAIPKDDPGRIKAALLYAIHTICTLGHTCVICSDLLLDTAKLLGLKQETIKPYIEELLENGELISADKPLQEYAEELGILYP